MNATARLPRWLAECEKPGGVGPFPYAKGPFVAYSLPLARALVPRLKAGEAHALNRSGLMLRGASGKLHKPRSAWHPSTHILYDDVYYNALLFELFSREPMLLV